MKNLKLLREKNNLSQAKLAELVNLSQQSICKYENGTNEASFATIKKMSAIFNVPAEYLIDDQIDISDSTKRNEYILDANEAYIINSFRKFDSARQDLILNLCRQLNKD